MKWKLRENTYETESRLFKKINSIDKILDSSRKEDSGKNQGKKVKTNTSGIQMILKYYKKIIHQQTGQSRRNIRL